MVVWPRLGVRVSPPGAARAHALRLTIRGLEADIAERGHLLDDARRQAASLIDDLRGQVCLLISGLLSG